MRRSPFLTRTVWDSVPLGTLFGGAVRNLLLKSFLCSFLICPGTNAANQIESARLVSGDCSGFTLKGSGLLFQTGGKSYLVTSQWNITERSGKTCHSVSFGHHGAEKADLLRADWGSGLALLSVSGLPTKGLIRLEDFSDSIPDESTAVEITQDGNPAQAALVIRNQSHRHHIPFQSTVLEVQGAAVSGEAVGSVVRAHSDPSQFIGIVSNQFLSPMAGGATETGEWKRNQSLTHDDLLVIPAVEVKKWITQVLAHPSDPAHFYQSDDAKLGIEDSVTSGELKVTTDCQASSDSSPTSPSSPDDDGMGGAPVGGSDGVGVGGSNGHPGRCLAQLWLQSPAISVFPTSLAASFYSDAVNGLKQGNQFQVPYFIGRNDKGIWETLGFSSSSEFFQNLNLAKYSPLVEKTMARTPETGTASFLELREKSLEMMTLADDLRFKWGTPFLENAYLTGRILRSENWKEVNGADLGWLLAPHPGIEEGWISLQMVDKDNAEKLRDLFETIKKLRESFK